MQLQLKSGDEVSLKAYNSIRLEPGTKIKVGASFHAYIIDCPDVYVDCNNQ